MRIKKYTGGSMKEVTDQMKRELGPDALILSSRKINPGGVFNARGDDLYEVTAAMDSCVTGPPPSSKTAQPLMYGTPACKRKPMQTTAPRGAKVLETVTVDVADDHDVLHATQSDVPVLDHNLRRILREFDTLKSEMKEVTRQMKTSAAPEQAPVFQAVIDRLIRNDVDEKLAVELVEAVRSLVGDHGVRDSRSVQEKVVEHIAGMIKTAPPGRSGRKRPRVIALVGPTGVGKTTTIGKLSSINRLIQHEAVALISADTYRIGAVEQLRAFAEIAGIPIGVASNPSEMIGLIERFHTMDMIFIDTVGRCQRMDQELEELKGIINNADPDEVHLVLSATSSVRTMMDVLDRFAVLAPNRLIVSKLDEAVTLGSLVSVITKHRLPIAYLTTGQVVPYDILEADGHQIASMICGGGIGHA